MLTILIAIASFFLPVSGKSETPDRWDFDFEKWSKDKDPRFIAEEFLKDQNWTATSKAFWILDRKSLDEKLELGLIKLKRDAKFQAKHPLKEKIAELEKELKLNAEKRIVGNIKDDALSGSRFVIYALRPKIRNQMLGEAPLDDELLNEKKINQENFTLRYIKIMKLEEFLVANGSLEELSLLRSKKHKIPNSSVDKWIEKVVQQMRKDWEARPKDEWSAKTDEWLQKLDSQVRKDNSFTAPHVKKEEEHKK